MRIISLVPNGTEILFALGAGPSVLGVSHECDYPPEARTRPILTGSALAPGLAGAEIDAAVASQVSTGASLYTLDDALIARLAPELVVTQQLCPVCAVSTAQVDGAMEALPRCPAVLSLDPTTLLDVLRDILRVGRALGREAEAMALVAGLMERINAVAEKAADRRPLRVVALEWLAPPYLAGHWVPEMIRYAGGEDCFAKPGEHSRRATWAEIAAAEPEAVLVMPCGYDEAGARDQLATLAGNPEWESLAAVRAGKVFPLDANGLFSRPGPRVVDGIERLAEIFAGLTATT